MRRRGQGQATAPVSFMLNPCSEIALYDAKPCVINPFKPWKEKFDPKRRWKYKKRRREPFDRIRVPLIRRAYPQLIANRIVGTQPLLGPTGLVYYLRFRYAQNHQIQSLVAADNVSPEFYDMSYVTSPADRMEYATS